LRWVKEVDGGDSLFDLARRHGGHATLFRNGNRNDDVFQALPSALMKIHQRLKTRFDPLGILNPGRMYKAF
jgi:glycolate oxidase FAD binding subunit